MLEGFDLDQIFARINSSGATSYFVDALGSTRQLTDGSAANSASFEYEPYGKVSRTGSDDTSFQFTGRENDGASGLQYNRARYYSLQP